MGAKVFGALLLIIAIAVFLTIQEEGVENAFGGVLAPVKTVRSDTVEHPLVGASPVNTGSGGTQTNYKKLADRVRTRAQGAMDQSERRASRY